MMYGSRMGHVVDVEDRGKSRVGGFSRLEARHPCG